MTKIGQKEKKTTFPGQIMTKTGPGKEKTTFPGQITTITGPEKEKASLPGPKTAKTGQEKEDEKGIVKIEKARKELPRMKGEVDEGGWECDSR